jgi:hypothetical protein
MSESFLLWVEIIFDVLYLATVWTLVVLMFTKRSNLTPENKSIGTLFLWAFFLLALVDTGHVGFRVLAYAMGGLEANPVLIGMGALATAITVTFFYMLVAEIWRIRFKRERGLIWWSLIIIGVIRLAIMIPAGNSWGSVVPPFNWSLARNIPLMIQGIGVAVLILIDAIKHNDAFSKKVSAMIFLSYLCYTPVILFVQKVPMLGMLMMPKTLAYVAVAFLAFSLFRKHKEEAN